MSPSSPFGARLSHIDNLQRRFKKALGEYWRVSRWFYGIVFAGLASWLLQSTLAQGTGLGNVLDAAPVRLVSAIPWPISVGAMSVIVVSLAFAGSANRDRLYYDLLDASAEGYRKAREGYRAIAAQPSRAGVDASRAGADGASGLTVFDQQLYTERTNAIRIYADFVAQRRERIFLAVGRGGSGKSTFLLRRMAELSGAVEAAEPYFRPHPCVFINCRLDHISDARRLDAIVKEKLNGTDIPAASGGAVRGHHDRALVIFIDAINENFAPAGDDINVHLTNFARQYLTGDYEIYVCLSVRKAYWDEQRRRIAANPTSSELGWLEHVYLPERPGTVELPKGAETVSVLLDVFADEEFNEAYAKHQQVYRMTGRILDERIRRICSNPLMLQIFCLTFRGQDISNLDVVRDLARDIDIFDAYAKGALVRAAEQVGLGATELVRHGETLPERAIRGLLLELALGMVERGRQFLSADEVFAIAQDRVPEALVIHGRRMDAVAALYQAGSPLRAILDEGIVLEAGVGSLPGSGEISVVRFVSERYFEYSIGRALVRRWRVAGSTAAAVIDDFRGQMHRHATLRTQSFDNLRQGLGMAVLVAEQDDPQLPPLPSAVHLELLDVLTRDASFDWNQLACRVVQQLRTFNRAPGPASARHSEEVEALLGRLDELAKKNDFVLRWDVERALLHAVEAGEGADVLRHLQLWMEPAATFSQRLFSGESLGYLFKRRIDQRDDVVKTLGRIIHNSNEMDFWIIRSVMFSVATMMDALAAGEADGEAHASVLLDAELRRMPRDLLRLGSRWWDRSVVIAAQVGRDSLAGQLAPWLDWPWASESPWTRVNAVLATEQACAQGRCNAQTLALLRALWQSTTTYDPHLAWAISLVLGPVAASTARSRVREAAGELGSQVRARAKRVVTGDQRAAAWVVDDGRPGGGSGADIRTPLALIYHPEYSHVDLHNHPESKERLQAILDTLEPAYPADPGGGGAEDRRGSWTHVSPYRFEPWHAEAFLGRAHPREWIRRVQELSRRLADDDKPDIVLESDLEVRAGSYEGAALAVRGAVCAMDVAISCPQVQAAVALVRPPGHLAGNKICIFNNVAVAARYGQEKLGQRDGGSKPRVLIVDCDAHHGKSTQDIFYSDESVLYFSTHQAGVHPGTGLFSERGSGPGLGLTINVPMPAFSGDAVYAEVLRRILSPALDGFRPDLVLVSLGLDAYHADNFSQLELSVSSYRELASTIRAYTGERHVPVVAALEGGYDLASLGRCVLQFMSVFGDFPAPGDPAPRQHSSALDRYLSQGSDQTASVLDDADRTWLRDLDRLEAELNDQWRSAPQLTAREGR